MKLSSTGLLDSRPVRVVLVAVWFAFQYSVSLCGEAPDKKPDWWAFKPVTRPAVPTLTSTPSGIAASTNPIDLFVRAKLAELKLSPSPEADPITLIRRLSYDLTGLPPTPDEVDAFAKACRDAGANPARRIPHSALEQLVDRLLASPRHGERWARHWLDVVHFGETHGYDKDKIRMYAWPYRDYVIRAFNDDKPYSRFVEEQLAGDVLYPDEPDGVVALGFIAAGPWDFVGHVELPESKTDGLIARYNDRDDMVMTTLSTFQSLTVHCARCHDHKFDPISQRDYYALQAVFAGVDRANRPYDTDPETHRQRRALMAEKKTLESRQSALASAREKISSSQLVEIDQRLAAISQELDGDPSATTEQKGPSNGYHSNIEPKPDVTKWVQVDLGRSVALDEIHLVPAHPTDFPDTPGFGFPTRFRIELSSDSEFNTSTLLADHTAADFKNPGDVPVVFTLSPAQSGGEGGRRPGEGEIHEKGLARNTPLPFRFIRVTALRLWERTRDYVFALGELQAFAHGTNVARGAVVTALDSIEAGRWSKKNLVDGYSSRARLGDVVFTPQQLARRRELEIEAKRLSPERQRVFESLVPATLKADLSEVESRLAAIKQALGKLPEPKLVYAATGDFKPEGSFVPPKGGMREVHFLPRGDVKRPEELMQPSAPSCVPGPNANFNLGTNHTEGERRAALAKWITDPRNHQTRRSIVNRVWQYHFGRGLVDSPNDFGHMGSLPTHAELLDWLAYWFLENGESVKKLHRLIVTSATYRQTTENSTEGNKGNEGNNRLRKPTSLPSLPSVQTDSENRFLWRMNRARLDAESIRDAMLFVSGQLDLTMGGPSDRQFFFKDDHSPVYDYTRFDVDAKAGRRRSIYRHIVRSVTDPFMDCLDAADPSQLVARRNTTLTALQALATLNNPFVLKQCEHFAERLQNLTPDLPEQITAAYRLALSRPPSASEKQRLADYARKHGLANACRVLFNSTEFMFVD